MYIAWHKKMAYYRMCKINMQSFKNTSRYLYTQRHMNYQTCLLTCKYNHMSLNSLIYFEIHCMSITHMYGMPLTIQSFGNI